MSTAIRTNARWSIGVVTASVALLTGCSGDAPPAGRPTSATPTSAPASAAPAAPSASGGVPDLSAPETVATGLDVPWGLAFLPDGSALVAERDRGRVLRVAPGGGAPRQVFEVPGVAAAGEGGLLGLAVARDYAETGWVYAYHTAADDNRIVRFKLGGGAPEVLFDGIDKAGIHNGGRIAFGPDGMLYAGTGDAGEGSASQDPGDSNGKILRLTPEGRAAPGNPTPGSPVWSLGHRNVQGLAWAADGTMYGIEFGQNRFDEVNVIKPGRNYGWPEVEGKGGGSRYADPIVTWTTDVASPSGAAIAGDTLYVAALRGQRLWTVPLGGGEPRAEFPGRYGRLRTVAVAPDGALWLTTSNTDRNGDGRDGDDRILRFPAR
ncbi:glucose/arabinose dehydrogenase [Actinoplanes digitatis]|uniref:Glucose/arabinose dehydrogenase n=2 Tax=Actinoplanes digitatis TaxID=1868 RepID=A0A7W7HUT6_9ACTN|nr:PQQ-dependent sugar dehydrogenase [Actinoplanes digitatis]MBB4761088.1 glucose/arabinose dehydrogenase [Actinoplanes digitatis]